MRILLPESLRELADGQSMIELPGDGSAGLTIGQTLGALRASHPGLYDRLMTEQGALRPHVNVFSDGEDIRYTGGLATAVRKDSEILVLPAISGG